MNFPRLDATMRFLDKLGCPVAELAVTKDGETIYRNAIGFSDSAKTKPVKNTDIYWIFSATKVVTCTAAMRLVERGLLDLNDPLSKYFPEFEHMMIKNEDGTLVPAQNPIRIVHLFTMTAGFDYNDRTPEMESVTDRTTQNLVRAMATKPLHFEPGTRYRYSVCHDILAGVVEVVSGKRYADYVAENILNPLGIVDMGFHPSDEQKARFSAMYKYKDGIMNLYERDVYNQHRLSEISESGGAGLFATVDEYIKIITALSLGGTAKNGYVLLRPETIEMMKPNRLCPKAIDDLGKYGYGWGLCCRTHMDPEISFSRSPAGEMGWDGAAGAYVMIDTDNRLAMYFGTHILLCPYIYKMIHPRLRDSLYEDLAGK